jgi:hypothetical protein
VRTYKAAVTTLCREHEYGWIVWQRGYHDRIIRCKFALTRARRYVRTNPERWNEDPINPDVCKS